MNNYNETLAEIMRYFKLKHPSIPDRILDRDANRIINIYKKNYTSILNYLVSELAITGDITDIKYNTHISMMAQIESMLKSMEVEVRTEVTAVIEKQFMTGSVYHYAIINGVTDLNTIMKDLPFSSINWSMANQLIQDTMEDLLYATSFTEISIKRLIKDVTAKQLQLGALKGESYKVLKRNIVKELSASGLSKSIKQKGFVGVIDKGGKKWNILNYTDMLVKTKMQQAYTDGIKEEALASGHDLAQIPHKGAVDHCRNFEGMIISMTGQTKGFYTYDQLKATNLIFHPRCRHTPIPVYSIDSLHEEDVQDHLKKVADLKKINKKTKK